MTFKLDHIQCLNPHALFGAQRGGIATMRCIWAIQDRIMLTREEETRIALRRRLVAG